ncbi:MAG: pyridoxal phosphate-dependent aminotransferase [Proteobacteria bacterium]|nr:pyridoxal phosphate-dependent aminotransferase [Pseudomonadota bacterium]MBU1584696.1 pyridoxal phosphate-dependent aminotransferase [Pseudomonadota bacterium]MBU2453652.1 pyridoxal phosphate-dependent aminotransferase [Pseudomonadota bacterium]MBU2629819.1 pyridoxal phosphate-dependent aminotransferase [Pseudomonadota bacterium]
MKTIVNRQIINQVIECSGLHTVGRATIREMVGIINAIELKTDVSFIRMEMGEPGLVPPKIGIQAEKAALKKEIVSQYPMIEGIASLKHEMSRFVKLFLDVTVAPKGCIPTNGNIQGGFASLFVACRRGEKNTTLFLDPGYPLYKQQLYVMGLPYKQFDVTNFRHEKLEEKLNAVCSSGQIGTIVYANPNNPAWICFTDRELEIIAQTANKYNIIIIEDLACIGMDFGKDISTPGQAPFQASVAKYTDNYILLFSASNMFSYAGQRIGCMVISDILYAGKFPGLTRFFPSDELGHAVVYGAMYALSAGVSHSAQHGFSAMLKAVNDGTLDFIRDLKTYENRSRKMKQIFLDNGFDLVYEHDADKPAMDGYYFCFSYPGFSGVELVEELLYYGISAISLFITGSERLEGVRACVSKVDTQKMKILESRLAKFNKHHSGNLADRTYKKY